MKHEQIKRLNEKCIRELVDWEEKKFILRKKYLLLVVEEKAKKEILTFKNEVSVLNYFGDIQDILCIRNVIGKTWNK